MKQCLCVVEDEYDGELRFSITDSVVESDSITMTLGAKDGDELIGMKVIVPLITRRMLFKSISLIPPNGSVKIKSIGEKSDRLIQTLVKYYEPAYPCSDEFTKDEVVIDYTLRNQGVYDIHQDKIYLKFYYDEEQDEDLPKDERVHLNMNFSFNLSRETAGLVETKEGYSADLLTFLMK